MVVPAVERGSTREQASLRAERIRAGLESYAVLRDDIATAYLSRDWITLEYASWDQYVETEFAAAARLSLPREERRELVAYFRDQGMSTRAIAAATGAHQETVVNDLKQVNGIRSPAPSAVVGIDGKTYTPSAPEPDVVEAEIVEEDVPAAAQVPGGAERSPGAAARRRELMTEWAAKSWTSGQMAERLGLRPESVRKIARDHGIAIPADDVLGRIRKLDSNRIVRQTVDELDGLDVGLNMVRFDELDRAEIPNWTTSLTASIRVLNRLNKHLKEMIQ